MKKICALVASILLITNSPLLHAVLITNTPSSISLTAFSLPSGRFWLGSAADGNANLSLASAIASQQQAFGYANAQARVNGVDAAENPLYNAAISQLVLLGESPLLVLQSALDQLVTVASASTQEQQTVYTTATDGIHDALNNPNALIAAVKTTASSGGGSGLAQPIYAYVAPAGGQLGDAGSGLAVGYLEIDKLEKTGSVFVFDDVRTSTPEGNLAMPLDRSSFAYTFGTSALNQISNPSLVWDESLMRLFIASTIQVGDAPESVGCGVVLGVVGKHQLFPTAIVNAAALEADSIIASSTPSATITLNKIATTTTTCRLPLLIVAGGVGDSEAVQSSVYALPLVRAAGRGALVNGMLANCNGLPTDVYFPSKPHKLVGRFMTDIAQAPGDLYTSSDTAAIVGGGQAPGIITDLIARDDAVIVATENDPASTVKPGLFFSQALFDQYGRVQSWTPWQRYAGGVGNCYAVALDQTTGNAWYTTGESGAAVNELWRTSWITQTGLAGTLQALFDQSYGVRGMVTTPYQAPWLDQTVGQRLSLLTCVGYNQVVIVQTGGDTAGQFGPLSAQEFTNQVTFDQGTLYGFTPGMNLIAVQNGYLKELGPLHQAVWASDGDNAWLVVAGPQGVAVLAAETGAGAAVPVGSGFEGFSSSLKFLPLGNFTQVRQVVADGNVLYVMTQSGIERLTLTPELVAQQGAAAGTIICDRAALPALGTLTSLIASGPLCLVGTTTGLWRNGNGTDITAVASSFDAAWTTVPLNDYSAGCAIHQMLCLSANAQNPVDLDGANLYVLSSSSAYYQAQLYRFTIDLTQGVTATAVQPLNDTFIQDVPSFLGSYNSYRNRVYTDGSALFSTRSQLHGEAGFLDMSLPGLQEGNPINLTDTSKIYTPDTLVYCSCPLRDMGSGCLMVATNQAIALCQ
jgi:hypothetical protein